MLKRLLLICLICIPVAVWGLYKQARVLAPEWNGVSCVSDVICMENAARHPEAAALYEEAYASVNASLGAIENKPRAIFCGSQACFEAFGFDKAAAHTVGGSGIVIGPRGWKDYYLRHEMIHHLQAERLGVFRQWLSPDWFKEGMAYALSRDPRPKLSAPWGRYRAQFEKWYRFVGKERLWEEARKLYPQGQVATSPYHRFDYEYAVR
ncbi:MAG: hypothetical protein OXE44_14125 [Nitrospinae bacterium]|nr:hypothetical protein [Nitrospinota bacterium]